MFNGYDDAFQSFVKNKTVMGAKDGDLVLILSGDNANKTRIQL